MERRRTIITPLLCGTLLCVCGAAYSADQVQQRDRLHTTDATATQQQLQTRDRLQTDAATATGAMTQARAQASTANTKRNVTRTRTQRTKPR